MLDRVRQSIYFLSKSKTLRNIGYLTAAKSFSQLISLIGAFYIPRILGVELYGQLTIVLTYVALFGLFSFSGLNNVIMRQCARDLPNAAQVFESFIGIKVLCSMGGSILCILCLLFVDYDLGVNIFIIGFSISLVIKSFSSGFDAVYQSHENLKLVAIFSVVVNTLSVSLSIIVVVLGYGVQEILIVRLGSQALVAMLSAYYLSIRFFSWHLFKKMKWNSYEIKQGIQFSVLEMLTVISTRIDLFMISIMGSTQEVGIYALAYNIIQKTLIVRQAISHSLFPVYVKKFTKEVMSMRTIVQHAFMICVPMLLLVLLIMLIAKPTIEFVVGLDYSQSAEIVNVLAIYLLFSFVIIPFSLSMRATNNQHLFIPIGFVRAFLNVVGNYFLYSYYGMIGIAYSTLVTFMFDASVKVWVATYTLNRMRNA